MLLNWEKWIVDLTHLLQILSSNQLVVLMSHRDAQVTVVKNQPATASDTRDMGLIPGLGRSSGEGNGNPLQYSCLEISMDRAALWAIVHGVAKSGI